MIRRGGIRASADEEPQGVHLRGTDLVQADVEAQTIERRVVNHIRIVDVRDARRVVEVIGLCGGPVRGHAEHTVTILVAGQEVIAARGGRTTGLEAEVDRHVAIVVVRVIERVEATALTRAVGGLTAVTD